MIIDEMREEFTARQHAEFFVDAETEKRHRAQSAVILLADSTDLKTLAWVCDLYNVTLEDIIKEKQSAS